MRTVSSLKNVSILLSLLFPASLFAQTTIVNYVSSWNYSNAASAPANDAQGDVWYSINFDDAAWSSNNSLFHVGESGGTDLTTLRQTTYFRKKFTIADPTTFNDFTLSLIRDDGAIVYVNGVEVLRSNMAAGAVSFSTQATSSQQGGTETTADPVTLATSYFVAGDNYIAVEVHQASNDNNDMRFQLQLVGNPIPAGTYVSYNSTWNYLVTASAAPSDWKDPSFAGSWSSGNAELGYGDGGEATTLGYGGDANNKYPTTYFRKTFNIASLSGITYFIANIIRDDGAVIYINGQEVVRSNMPTGTISYNTYASSAVGSTDETTAISYAIATSYFVAGTNTIAVELHQSDATSTDISFNLELVSSTSSSATLSRAPYLQVGTQNSVIIRWRTDIATDSKVDIGSSSGSYTTSFTDNSLTTEHSVTVTGLTADTKYFYQIGSTSQVLQGASDNFFRTLPLANTTRKIRIAAFGDCGRNDNSFRTLSIQHYQTHLTNNSVDAADALILLGDNAYTNGTEAEYITGFFTPMASLLKNHKVYPSPGNHDYYGTSQTSRVGAYYQNFTMPTAAEIGGVASGTEAYYSYDIGDIHFLSLDSYGLENSGATRLYDTTGAQVTWIKNDLNATTKKWIIAYWHHPPYTMGSHTSDGEAELVNIRQNFIKILERYGVDLIICGHSHDYERSYLLQGHYGNEASFTLGTHAKSSSSGKYDGTANSCPYVTTSGQQNKGTVYVVAGSAGADGGVQGGYPHNAMPYSIDDGGMFYFEVENNRLDAKFIRRDGSTGDQFTIIHDANQNPTIDIAAGQSVTLTASWPGTYVWNNAATTQSINVTPPTGTTVYTVNDLSSGTCLTDQITVRANVVLPVNLSKYNVYLRDNKVNIEWTTTSEANSKSFTVERSVDGINFETVTIVNAAGNSSIAKNYIAYDHNPLKGTSYYRLVQTDRDGRIKTYDVRKISVGRGNTFGIKTNQSGEEVTLSVLSTGKNKINLDVFDLSGRLVMSKTLNVNGGSNQEQIRLSRGSYVLNFIGVEGDRIVQKIVVQ